MKKTTLLLATALVIHAGAAAAQPTGDEQAAANAFARGKDLADKRNYVEAIESFEVAYRLRPHFMVQCSIARCHENLNKPIEAASHYRRCLDEGAAPTKLGKQVEASLRKMEGRVARVEVLSPGKGGTIHVDGREQGEAPATVKLNPGSHVIEVRRRGARAASATLKILGGERRSVTLVPLALQAEQPRSLPTSAPVETDRRRRRLSQVWFWTAAGLTGALAVTTTVLGVQTLKLKSDFDGDPTQQGADDFWNRRRLTNIFLATTLAAAGTGAALFFFTDFGGHEKRTDELTAGIGLQGTF